MEIIPLLDFVNLELTCVGAWLQADRQPKVMVNKDNIFIINGMKSSNN